jgi:tetratricopeptide (TPR) repeat protein
MGRIFAICSTHASYNERGSVLVEKPPNLQLRMSLSMARIAAAALLVVAFPLPNWAGIYLAVEAGLEVPAPGKALPPGRLQELISGFYALPNLAPNSPLKARYLRLRDDLRARSETEKRFELAGCLLRLGDASGATATLSRLVREDPNPAMVEATLATALAQEGRYEEAIGYLEAALRTWPTKRAGWRSENLTWWREVEKWNLRLMRLRQAKQGRKAVDGLDDLFGVRFVGDNGAYVAGKLAAAEERKLPREAIAIVQQILFWTPSDTRMYWLYGELLNASGQVEAAANVLDECVWNRRWDALELRQHRQVLQEAKTQMTAALPSPWAPAAAPAEAVSSDWKVNRTWSLVVGCSAGVVIACLAYYQIRESRRKRGQRGC